MPLVQGDPCSVYGDHVVECPDCGRKFDLTVGDDNVRLGGPCPSDDCPSYEEQSQLPAFMDLKPLYAQLKNPLQPEQLSDIAGEVLGAPYPDWPAWCQTFEERKAYQAGVAHARAILHRFLSPETLPTLLHEISTLRNFVLDVMSSYDSTGCDDCGVIDKSLFNRAEALHKLITAAEQ